MDKMKRYRELIKKTLQNQDELLYHMLISSHIAAQYNEKRAVT